MEFSVILFSLKLTRNRIYTAPAAHGLKLLDPGIDDRIGNHCNLSSVPVVINIALHTRLHILPSQISARLRAPYNTLVALKSPFSYIAYLMHFYSNRVGYKITSGHAILSDLHILLNSMTLTSFVFIELANTMKYGGGVLYTLVSTE